MSLIKDLVWIDQNIDEEENKSFIKKIKNNFGIKVARYSDVESGIKYISNCISFKLVLIIVSGKYFPSYFKTLQKYINDLTSIPITIIFTFDKKKFKENCPNKEIIDDEFYNIGGVADSFQDIEKYLNKYLKIKSSKTKIKKKKS